ncbi:MAG: hypothetical protein ACR2ML_05530 [Solirubrobacteraceae bacterium]
MSEATEPLTCPRCASAHPAEERFCPECGIPLVYSGGDRLEKPITERHERARKIKPQYAEGDLVRVAGGRNQVEAEFIQGLLLEEGVPSTLRRTAGFDVPDFLAAGPRDVLVPESGALAAREVLLETDLAAGPAAAGPAPLKLLACLIGGLALIAVIAWLVSALIA